MADNRKLVVSLEYMGEHYHANRRPHDGKGIGIPEWPPSPFRVSASTLCGADRLHEERDAARVAVGKLMGQRPPVILAAPLQQGWSDIARYVPHNHGDLMVRSGRPLGDDKVARNEIRAVFGASKTVLYVYDIDDDFTDTDVESLRLAAVSNNIVGTGHDMCQLDVYTSASVPDPDPDVLVWRPHRGRRDNPLRVHNRDTYDDLQACHESRSMCFSGGPGTYIERTIPTAFDLVSYIPSAPAVERKHVLFRIVDPKNPGKTNRFPRDNATGVSAWTRHAAHVSSRGWGISDSEVSVSVLGHSGDGEKTKPAGVRENRLSYIPIPSIAPDGSVCKIGLVAVAEDWGEDGRLASFAERLDGSELIERMDDGDSAVRGVLRRVEDLKTLTNFGDHYIGPSRSWRSVNPVVLDLWKKERKRYLSDEKFHRAVLKTVSNSGIPALVKSINFRQVHRRFGETIPVADRFKPRLQVHMEITFDRPVSGPLCIGGARHFGIGLMVAVPQND